jgi:signal transduction histidine kinase
MAAGSRTEFAPAQRSSPREIARQTRLLEGLAYLRATLDAVPQCLMMLNGRRQVVLANRALGRLLRLDDVRRVYGSRPGEALDCVHASDGACGCGTSLFCRACGAVDAILSSQEGEAAARECRILQKSSGLALDLRVSAVPFQAGKERFTVFAVSDIGDEKRRHALERLFFHDVLNTVGNLRTLAYLLEDANAEEVLSYRPVLRRVADELSALVREQQEFVAAEEGELAVRVAEVSASAVLAAAAGGRGAPPLGPAPAVAVEMRRPDPDFHVGTDETILGRILGNMLKNAVEASSPGDSVTLGCERRADGACFWVENPAFIPAEVQLQVFQRSFSTKGPGRGLGTYGMRLLAERYLGGRVTFTSSRERGTRFEVFLPERRAGASAAH